MLLQVEGDMQQGGAHSLAGSAEIEEVILGLLADIVGAVGSHQPFMEVRHAFHFGRSNALQSMVLMAKQRQHNLPVPSKNQRLWGFLLVLIEQF